MPRTRILPIILLLVSVFAIAVMVWYFFFYSPKQAPTLQQPTPTNPFPILGPRANFIFNTLGIQGNQTSSSTTEVTPASEQALIHIWEKPTAGNAFLPYFINTEVFATTTASGASSTTPVVVIKKLITSTSSRIAFVDRTTGYIYTYNKEKNLSYQVTNTTIPGVYDAYFYNGGKNILMRYLDTDNTTIVSITAQVPEIVDEMLPAPLTNIVLLPKNVSSVAVSASLQKISYIVPSQNGSTFYTITDKGQQTIATSPFSEWLLSYGGEQLYATTKASAYIEGTTVQVPGFSKRIANKTGLLTNPSQESTLLHSMWSQTGLVTFLSKEGVVSVLPLKTLSSKCVWENTIIIVCANPKEIPRKIEGLPDDWYQGRYSFSDSLAYINTTTNESFPLYSFPIAAGEMDITHLRYDSLRDDITFINRNDASLWLLKLSLIGGE